MKLLDDWTQDVDVILNEYYKLFYGPSEKYMKNFFEKLEKTYCSDRKKKSKYINADYDWMTLCPPGKLEEFGKLINTALSAAPGNSVYRKRVLLIKDAIYEAVMKDGSKRIRKIMNDIKSLNCVKTHTTPVIDGKMDDKCWGKAEYAKSWRSYDGNPEPVKTEVACLYDDNYLYLFFKCYDKPDYIPVAKCKTRDGRVYVDDSVEIFIDPGRKINIKEYYQYVLNTVPVMYDAKGRDSSWQSNAEYAANKSPEKWTDEVKIPLGEICPDKIKSGDIWGINFCRNRRGLPGFVSPFINWSGPNGYHAPNRFGKMIFK